MEYEDEFERAFRENLQNIEREKGNFEEDDLKIHEMVCKIQNKQEHAIPEPTEIKVSTRSGVCKISDRQIPLHLGKLVSYLSRKIFENYFEKNKKYPILGIKVDNLMIRYDEIFIKKYKRPYIKYNNELLNPCIREECMSLLERIEENETETLNKQGRQKERKEDEHFYNSCTVIVKASRSTKCVDLLLFNNGTIRIAGAKEENDGLRSCEVLLEEMKKERSIFFEMEEEEIQNLRVQNYRTTMINSDFKLNFKVDLKTFLNCIQRDMSNVFTKFNPDKYRGLILGFFWNMNKEKQNGICGCETRCKGKGTGNGVGECKKITISIFKSGSTIITGARSMEQIECAYAFLIHLVKIYYGDIMKVSIVDYLEKPNEEIDFDEMERYIAEEEKKVKEEEKKKKKKLVKDA